jgi:uncharacterized protein
MPQRQILIAALLALLAALLPTSARADQRSVQCAIQWSGLQGSNDRAVLSNFAARCAGTDAGRAAAARIATLRPRPVVVQKEKPKRESFPKLLPVKTPPRQLSWQDVYANGLAEQNAGRIPTARAFFAGACDGGFGQACHDLGLSYAVPRTGQADYPNARRVYRQGCQQKHQASCMGLVSYAGPKAQGGYVAADYRYGLDQLCRAFNSGEHCNLLGVSYSTAAEGANYPLALDALKRGCTTTTVLACESLRVFYSFPQFTNPVNLPLARDAFDRAFGVVVGSPTCSGVYAQSCLDLSNYYWSNAREGNDAKRYALNRGACDGGVAVACGYAAAAIWMSGGRFGNRADLRPLYTKACNAPGGAEACKGLADALRDASLGAVDAVGAQAALTKACQGGYKAACPPTNAPLAPTRK